MSIPLLDPSVRYVGVSKLRDLNATKLKQFEETFVFQDNDNPVAVLLSYEKYLAIQNEMLGVVNTMELMSEKSELQGILAGLQDVSEDRTNSFAEIKARLRRKHGKTETTQEKAK
jgi:hypothetical protein